MGIKEYLLKRKQNKYANKQINKKAHAAYLREKEKQAIRVAKSKAKVNADKQISRQKSGGFFGAVVQAANNATKPTRKAYVRPMKKTSKKMKNKKKTPYMARKRPMSLREMDKQGDINDFKVM